jgi:site-specific DNA-cytosine methylase
MTYNAIDLFCGCGGFSQGISMSDSGINILAGIDIWDKAIHNYKKNHSHEAICEDLQKLPPEIFEKKYNKDKKKNRYNFWFSTMSILFNEWKKR